MSKNPIKKKVLTVDPKEELAITARALEIEAARFVVKSQSDLQAIGEFRQVIKGLRLEVDAAFDPIINANKEALAVAKAQKSKSETPLINADTVAKKLVAEWSMTQMRLKAAEDAKVRAEAEAAARAKAEEGRRLAAEELAEQDRFDEAVKVLEQEVVVRPVSVYIPPMVKGPVVKGAGVKMLWSAELVSLTELIDAVRDGRAPSYFLKADMVELNRAAVLGKENFQVPGVRAVSKPSVY